MYLSINDLKKGIRGEVLNVITREEDNAFQAITEAMAEVESYLSARYDIATELAKTPESDPPPPFSPPFSPPSEGSGEVSPLSGGLGGVGRLTMIVKLVRDIALYNCHNIAAPVNIPENRIKSYDNAIKFLRECQAEKASIPGLKRLNTNDDGTTSSNYIAFSTSSQKRNHHI